MLVAGVLEKGPRETLESRSLYKLLMTAPENLSIVIKVVIIMVVICYCYYYCYFYCHCYCYCYFYYFFTTIFVV